MILTFVCVCFLSLSHPAHVASAEDVEERRRQEGVFALLNLAQMTYSPASSMSSSTSTLSSPASSTGSLKRAAPANGSSDAPYAPLHNSAYRLHTATGSPDRVRTGSPQLPPAHQHHQHLHHHLQANGHTMHADQQQQQGVNTPAGGNILQTMPIVSYYGGGGGGSTSSSSTSSVDLARQYASPPPAKKTKPRSSLKKLKKKSLGR